MGLRKTIWRGLPLQLHDASGEGKSHLKLGPSDKICWNPVDAGGFREFAGHQPWLQHQWWDLWGGSSFECYIYFFPSALCLHINYEIPQNLSRSLYFVPSVRFLPLSGRSQSGVSVSSQSLTSDFIQFWSLQNDHWQCPRVYHYIIREDGQPMYLGHRNSVLYYNASLPSWVWYDRKDNRSVAISISPESSLFLGLKKFLALPAQL